MMQVYFGTYEGWCGLFCLLFCIFGLFFYMLYQNANDTIKTLESQSSSYAAELRAEKDISNNLEKEVTRLRKEIQELRQTKSKEKNKEISW